MWLATRYGFYSIVCAHDGTMPVTAYKQPHQTLMMIRARKHGHLVVLRAQYPELGKIVKNTGTDYPYRIIAERDDVMAVVRGLVDEINYTNFKGVVQQELSKDTDYLSFLHRVWAVGCDMMENRFRAWVGKDTHL